MTIGKENEGIDAGQTEGEDVGEHEEAEGETTVEPKIWQDIDEALHRKGFERQGGRGIERKEHHFGTLYRKKVTGAEVVVSQEERAGGANVVRIWEKASDGYEELGTVRLDDGTIWDHGAKRRIPFEKLDRLLK